MPTATEAASILPWQAQPPRTEHGMIKLLSQPKLLRDFLFFYRDDG